LIACVTCTGTWKCAGCIPRRMVKYTMLNGINNIQKAASVCVGGCHGKPLLSQTKKKQTVSHFNALFPISECWYNIQK